jgi:uncharacterized membrane protein
MPSSESAQIIMALATLLASLGALVTSVVSSLISLRNARKIEEVHAATNGLTRRLETAANAAGIIQGVKEEKDRREAAADDSN